MNTIRILSRNSSLAKIQAHLVADEIKKKFPDMIVTHSYRDTKGDIDLSTPLSKMPEQGVFTSDLRDALLNNETDMVVHSWKDLPIEMPKGTDIVSTLARSDSRDILFFKKDSIKKKSIKIYSSSPRRERNLSMSLPDLLPWKISTTEFHPIRGNIQTRFSKFLNDTLDGVVIAKAAIDRLARDQDFVELYKKNSDSFTWMILPNSINPCAPGQGALAIEVAENNDFANSIAASINDESTFDAVFREREILSQYGGGCHQKIGVSYISHKLGLVVSKRGEDENGNHFESWDFIDPKDISFSSNTTDEIYPENLKNYKIFSRKQLNENVDDINNLQNKCIYVSRISSIPDKSKIQSNNVIWTSGLRTWKNLSERGIWVNGTSDGLGEDFDKDINSLTNNPWVKLTHSQSPESSIKNKIETYQLESIDFEIDIEKKKYFYWMSSSAFKASIDKYPKIIEKYHFCGPGNTYNEISKILGNDKNLFVELSYDSWKKKLLKA